MYDAKLLNEEDESSDLRYPVIMDRAYFNKVQAESIANFKTSHIPMEGLIKLE